MSLELDSSFLLHGHTKKVWCVSWSPDGKILASCGEDKQINLWKNDGENWFSYRSIANTHTRTIRCVSWSPCGKYIASCSFDGTASIWDASNDFEFVASLDGHESEVKCVDWSVSGLFLSTCSRDKSVWVWEVLVEENEFECVAVLHNHTQDIKKVKWHPIKDILFSISYDNTVKVYSADLDGEWNCISTLNGHTSTVWGIAFNKLGDKFVTCSDDMSVILWAGKNNSGDRNDYEKVFTCSNQNTRPIYDITWSKDDYISTASGDNSINIYQENSNELKLILNIADAHTQDVNSVVWNPVNGFQLASCSDDGLIKIWTFKLI